jgi:hypothetical protein
MLTASTAAQEANMMVVRNRHDGRPLTWGTDHRRMQEIAASNPDYVAVEDRAAPSYYCHVPRLRMGQVHPYDLSAQKYAEIKP